jgi:hypothetical protein
MPTVCIQCSMRAMLNDEPPPTFDETAEEHQRRVHPDLVATQRERIELERQLAEKFKR